MTRFQLRRLALQATRRPELLPVLQDALLESAAYGPAFERAIADAHALADTKRLFPGYGIVVAFGPGKRPPFLVVRSLIRDLGTLSRVDRIPVYVIPWRRP